MRPEPATDYTRKILIIGIGAGDPNQLTLEAVEALRTADIVFLPGKGEEKAELGAVRLALLERFTTVDRCRRIDVQLPERAARPSDYHETVADWHAEIGRRYHALFERHIGRDDTAALLIWGDPALYDSMLRILDRIVTEGLPLDIHVIPGISSVQLLAARHRIPLHAVGQPVTILPARALGFALPAHLTSAVIVLDADQAFLQIEDADIEIFWGASLGLADEILIAGPLAEVKHRIAEVRAEARKKKGWLMDTYLLRRRRTES